MKVAVSLEKKHFSCIKNYRSCLGNWCRYSKGIHCSGTTTLIISNKEMSDIIKIVLVLGNSNILPNRVTKLVTNETRDQRWGFLGTLVRTLGSILLGNLLSGKGILRAGSANQKGKRIVRADYGKEWDFWNHLIL